MKAKQIQIAVTLLKGINNIDLMSQQVDTVIDILIRIIGVEPKKKESNKFEGNEGYWTVYIPSADKRCGHWISIFYHRKSDDDGHIFSYSSNPYDDIKLPVEAVQSSFNDLSILITGILKMFPEIEKDQSWNAFVNAGTKSL